MISTIYHPLPSSCYGVSKKDLVIKGCILHYMSAVNIDPKKMFDLKTNIQILKDYGVGYHFLIDRMGMVYQLTPLSKQAYHAGESRFKKLKNCNEHSVGICLLGGKESMVSVENSHFTLHQYGSCASVINTMKEMSSRFIDDYVTGHENVATPKGRREDPGERFNWKFLGEVMEGKYGTCQINAEDLIWR